MPDGGFLASWSNGRREEISTSYRYDSTGVQLFLPDSALLQTVAKTVAKTVAELEAYRYIVNFNNPTDSNDGVSLRLKDGGTIDLAGELEGLRGATVFASDEGNTIITGAKDDALHGGADADQLEGGAGNDRYYVNDAEDIVIERKADAGSDAVLASVSYVLDRGVAVELLRTSSSTSTAAINLYGNERSQTIEGNRGANRLSGRDGNDTLSGGGGRDILIGGAGNDKFVFDYSLKNKTNVDVIQDFFSPDDIIARSSDVFKGINEGRLAASAFKEIASATSTKGVDGSDRILYDKAHGDLYFDQDGSGAKYGRIKFTEVANNTSLDGSDFLIV